MFAVTFNPKLPSIANIIGKHWRTMTRDTKLKNTFPEPPMVAYKQPPNIRKILCRAKLPPKAKFKPDRKILGMKKCGKPCIICDYVYESKEIRSTKTREKFKINGEFTCFTSGVIYITTCSKCHKQYVGQTGRNLKERIYEHLQDIKKGDKTSGLHYNSAAHEKAYMIVQIIEKVTPNTEFHRLEREDFWIKKLVTKAPFGLNENN